MPLARSGVSELCHWPLAIAPSLWPLARASWPPASSCCSTYSYIKGPTPSSQSYSELPGTPLGTHFCTSVLRPHFYTLLQPVLKKCTQGATKLDLQSIKTE